MKKKAALVAALSVGTAGPSMAYEIPRIDSYQSDYEAMKSQLADRFIGDSRVLLSPSELHIAESLVQAEYAYDNMSFGYLDDVLRSALPHTKGTEYAQAYEDNELRADKEYKGKTLLVKGYVKDISRDILGNPFVSLNGVNQFQPVLARFDDTEENLDYLTELSKETIIDLVCTGAGYSAMSAVLADCYPYQRLHDDIARSITRKTLEDNNDVIEAVAKTFVAYEHDGAIFTPAMYVFTAKLASSSGVECEEAGETCFEKIPRDGKLAQKQLQKMLGKYFKT